MTQWIFGTDTCTCSFVHSKQTEPSQRCENCKLPVRTFRHGSMTQWIFGQISCRCSDTTTQDSERIFIHEQHSAEDSLALEPEIELSEEPFPKDRYKPISVLGKGATGVIYLARDRLLGKKVAVKVLHELTNQQMLSFQTEAKATSTLNHPNILTINDFGPTDEGTPFMVFEYFSGISLDQYIMEEKFLSQEKTKIIFLQITDALIAAHRNGIFHRDLKPSNIILNESGSEIVVKLIDFGIAKMKLNQFDTFTMQDKLFVGTPAYMSADSVSGKSYDERSEVYSIGCMLYEALSGQVPFQGKTPLDTMRLHATEPVAPPSHINDQEDISEFENIILKCLEKEPDQRFQSMEELHEAIDSLDFTLPEKQISVEHVSKRRKEIFYPLAICLTLLAVSVAATYLFFLNSNNKIKTKGTKVTNKTYYAGPNSKEISELEHADRSIEELTRSATNGNSKDQFLLALAYAKGNKGLEVDEKTAFHWMNESARNGSVDAQIELGHMYLGGFGVTRDINSGKKWILKAAEKGNIEAMHILGDLYFQIGETDDDKRAGFYWHKKAADYGHKDSIHQLGSMYFVGSGVKRNYKLARKYFLKAEKLGVPEAPHQLGVMYQEGLGVNKDINKAKALYYKSANLGVAQSMVQLGNIYLNGIGVKPNPVEALKWYKQGAEKKCYSANSQIGL